jgi:hypothetical protein
MWWYKKKPTDLGTIEDRTAWVLARLSFDDDVAYVSEIGDKVKIYVNRPVGECYDRLVDFIRLHAPEMQGEILRAQAGSSTPKSGRTT